MFWFLFISLFHLKMSMVSGVEIGNINTNSSVRTCNFSYSANMAAFSTDTARKQVCEIIIVDVRNADKSIGKAVILVFFRMLVVFY